jgi:hypothetical protein
MVCLEAERVGANHKDDIWAFWLDDMCHMCEHNRQQMFANEAIRMSASPPPWSWQYQNVQQEGNLDNSLIVEGVMNQQGDKGDSCRRVSYLAI